MDVSEKLYRVSIINDSFDHLEKITEYQILEQKQYKIQCSAGDNYFLNVFARNLDQIQENEWEFYVYTLQQDKIQDYLQLLRSEFLKYLQKEKTKIEKRINFFAQP